MVPDVAASARSPIPVPKPSNVRWVVIALLFAATTNNYLDRIVLGILVPEIMQELHFDKVHYGYITGAFQLTYAFGYLGAGWLIDRIGTRVGYALSIAVWSAAAALHAFALGWVQLALWRAVLGIGEAGNFPAGIKAVSEWFPKRDRAYATGIFNSGTNVASMIGPPVFVWLNFRYGWRACFIAIGASGIVCLVLWLVLYKLPGRHPLVNDAERDLIASDNDVAEEDEAKLPWSKVILYRQTWGFGLAKFFSDPVWWFYSFWLALYFKEARGMTLEEIGWAIPVIYTVTGVGSVAGGWASGWLIRRGWRNGPARKVTMGVFALCMPVAATAVLMPKVWMAVGLIGLATAAHQGWSANLYTAASDIFPKNAVASVTGFGGFCGGIGGVIFTAWLPGHVVTHFGYGPLFVIMGSFHIIGWLCAHFLMGRMEPLNAAQTEAAA